MLCYKYVYTANAKGWERAIKKQVTMRKVKNTD